MLLREFLATVTLSSCNVFSVGCISSKLRYALYALGASHDSRNQRWYLIPGARVSDIVWMFFSGGDAYASRCGVQSRGIVRVLTNACKALKCVSYGLVDVEYVRHSMRVLFTMSCNNILLNIIPALYEGYIVSVHRMVVENCRPVDSSSCWPWQHPGESPTYILHTW